MNLLRCMSSVWLRKVFTKNDENICCNNIVIPDFVPIVCFTSKDKSVYIPPHKRNQKVERKALKSKPPSRSQPKVLDGSKFVPTCHHCGVIGHIRFQCHKLKREQNHVTISFPKKPGRPKHIVCHHCGAFGHLRLYYSKFHAFKRIKRKEKLKLLGSCVKKGKPNLSKNSMLLKKVFNALNSLSMCISRSHSFNLHLSSHETLTPNNCSVWMRKGSYGWDFAFLVIDLILSIFVGPFMHWMSYLHTFCASCISLYALFCFDQTFMF